MKENLEVKKLTNKQPTKDITLDDIKYKIPKITSKKKKTIKISEGLFFSDKTIPIISGPNGVESRELIFKVAKKVKSLGLKILRGHAYKPLTFFIQIKEIP